MTAQAHEQLILDGEKTSMAFCPPLPENHPRIAAVDPDRVPREEGFVFSKACWRGYIGSWEIKDGRFYLVGLMGKFRLVGSDPLHADWFSGVLRVPRGEMLQYVHMGFGTVYEQELHVKIEKGIVVKTRVVNNRGKRHDGLRLGWANLPGNENEFPGDDEL